MLRISSAYKAMTKIVNFEVLLDDRIAAFWGDPKAEGIDNKHLLSSVNSFEDRSWNIDGFESFIWDNIADTALSIRERQSLVGNSYSILMNVAKNLRLTDSEDDPGRGSEMAEAFLYGVMKHHFKALPVVPKIFYKQNSQDNAKGADSVHIVVADDNTFTIWFGEAKFYNDIGDARLGRIVESIDQALASDKLKKERSIITNVGDIDLLVTDLELRKRIRDALSNRNSLDELKPILHVPILFLHECGITKLAQEMNESYRQDILKYHRDRAQSYFAKQRDVLSEKIFKYESITFHLIIFPVPSKSALVESFLKKTKFFKGK